MKNRLLALQDTLRSSYWFIPSVMAFLGIVFSILTIKIDEEISRDVVWVMGLVYVNSPEGARAVLSTIAGSMITVAGVVFSLTMVVLSLTAQQYGSLVLDNFLRDRGNQFVLGIFTATFIFCLLVLRSVRGVDTNPFIPHISVLVGIGLSIASLVVLIYFIHHVSTSIRASTIVAHISNDLIDAIETLYPGELGVQLDQDEPDLPVHFDAEAQPIRSQSSGYLQFIDDTILLDIAGAKDVLVELKIRPGYFVVKGSALAYAWPANHVDAELSERINDALIIGDRRTQAQDVEFLVDQLVAMAVRAMSPAINDPFTTMMVIDRLGEGLCCLATHEIPARFRYDRQHKLRVITNPITFEGLVRSSFDQIRHYSQKDRKVMIRLLRTLRTIHECAPHGHQHDTLGQYMDAVWKETRSHLPLEDAD